MFHVKHWTGLRPVAPERLTPACRVGVSPAAPAKGTREAGVVPGQIDVLEEAVGPRPCRVTPARPELPGQALPQGGGHAPGPPPGLGRAVPGSARCRAAEAPPTRLVLVRLPTRLVAIAPAPVGAFRDARHRRRLGLAQPAPLPGSDNKPPRTSSISAPVPAPSEASKPAMAWDAFQDRTYPVLATARRRMGLRTALSAGTDSGR